MNFKTLDFNPINEKISFNYKIPKNKEQLMYDFYLLTSLPLWGLDGSAKRAPVAEGPAMQLLAKDAQKKLVKYLKDDLLSVVHFAVASEFRHAYAFTMIDGMEHAIGKTNSNKYISNISAIEKGWRANYDYEMAKHYKKEIRHYLEWYVDDKFWDNIGRTMSYNASNKMGSPKKFIELALKTFTLPMWNSDYGGKAWHNIAKGWLKLNSSTNYNDMVVYIDHVFDLQHNTDSVLNKSKSYADTYGTYTWIGTALEAKKHATNLHELVNKASPTLKSFAARVIKAATGDTFDKWAKSADLKI